MAHQTDHTSCLGLLTTCAPDEPREVGLEVVMMSKMMFFVYEEFDVWFWRPVYPAPLRGMVGKVLGSDRFISALLDRKNPSCYRENFWLV